MTCNIRNWCFVTSSWLIYDLQLGLFGVGGDWFSSGGASWFGDMVHVMVWFMRVWMVQGWQHGQVLHIDTVTIGGRKYKLNKVEETENGDEIDTSYSDSSMGGGCSFQLICGMILVKDTMFWRKLFWLSCWRCPNPKEVQDEVGRRG